MMTFTDSHLHLPLAQEADGFHGGIVASARRSEWRSVLEACDGKRYYPCIGIHPWYVDEEAEGALDELAEILVKHPECGVGEIGLDGCPGHPAMEIQREWFRRQLQIASKYGRLAVLHIVRSWDDAFAVIRDFPESRLVIHGFHGTSSEVRRFLEFPRLYFSLGFDAMAPGKRLHAAIGSIPPERLLVDSDAPYRGHTTAELPQLIEAIAKMKAVPALFLAERITANWQDILGKS